MSTRSVRRPLESSGARAWSRAGDGPASEADGHDVIPSSAAGASSLATFSRSRRSHATSGFAEATVSSTASEACRARVRSESSTSAFATPTAAGCAPSERSCITHARTSEAAKSDSASIVTQSPATTEAGLLRSQAPGRTFIRRVSIARQNPKSM